MSAFARWLYRASLRLLPARIRAKHGRAMEQLFADELDRARRHGRVSATRVVLAAHLDVVRRSVYERIRSVPERPRASQRTPDRPEPLMSSLLYDVRHALRSLRRSPRFSLLAVVTLALGIGANVALFTVTHGVVLRPLPFPEAERVSHLAWDRGGSVPRVTMPAYKFAFWRERSRAFEAMTTWRSVGEVEVDGGSLGGMRVSHDFLDVLGWEPALGRGFTAEDDEPGAPDVAILGHDAWRERWAGDPDVVGSTVQVDGTPHAVIGVLPAGYAFPQAPDLDGILLPLRLEADPLDEGENWAVLARLGPGVDREQASADLARVYREFEETHPELMNGTDRAMVLASYQELYLGRVDEVLWALMGATVLVLLIACGNVAALLLARGTSRRGELGVRVALGAGRARIARQILAESLFIAVAASLVGLLLARVGVSGLLGLYPGELPRGGGIGLSGTVLAYAGVAALVTGVVFGLVAALPVLRRGAASTLRESGRGGTGRGGLRRLVLGAEAAVSVVLLVAAGLLIATLAEIRSVDPGFEPEGLLAASLGESWTGFESAGRQDEVGRRTLERLRSIPGVTSVATASTYPLRRGLNIPVGIQGRPDAYEGAVEWRWASPGYLETLRIPLLRGRALDESDRAGSRPVALVNEAFAERWFPGEDPLGRTIEIGRYRDRYVHPDLDVGGVEIVGVVGDVRETALTSEARQGVIVPETQVPEVLRSAPVVLVRHGGEGVRGAVRAALAESVRGEVAPEIRSMEEVLGESLAAERFNALLMSVFAGVALLLTAFGIYGVVSYGVRQRTREIGIRVALGARRGEVTRLVMGQGMVPVVLGLAVGVVVALGAARYIEDLLWGVEPTDPLTVVAVAGVLGTVAAISSWLPVREAAAIDPNRSLRPE